MSSVLAIVSKAVFEKQAKGADVGSVVAFDRYASAHATLDGLAEGGALFLVTVRPPDERLWLVGVLESPAKGKDRVARGARTSRRIVDISAPAKELVFASGKGLVAKKGALGMSLQTPRGLTEEDVAVLRKGVGGRRREDEDDRVKPKPEAKAKAKAEARQAAAPRATKEAVEAAIGKGDSAAALRAALAWWTATRAPALAELVGAISEHVSAPPISARDRVHERSRAANDPLDLGALLGAIA